MINLYSLKYQTGTQDMFYVHVFRGITYIKWDLAMITLSFHYINRK